MGKCKHGFDHACLICGFTHIDGKKVWFDWTWQEQQKRIDELQAKVDELEKSEFKLAKIKAIIRENPKILESILLREIKQALKGGEV